eukprot:2185078-Pyramimonas_sp.AAC.1
MACCREKLMPVTAELKQKDWDRRPIFTDARIGDFIFAQDWGKVMLPLRQPLPERRSSAESSHEQGAHLRTCHQLWRLREFFAVQVPILHYGLRWVYIWYCDKNLPLRGVIYGLPIRTDTIH